MLISWTLSGAWTFFFTRNQIAVAAIILVLAAATAISGTITECLSAKSSVVKILTISFPFSLYGGWLIVASSINVGILIFSQGGSESDDVKLLCTRDESGNVVIPDPVGLLDLSLPLILVLLTSVLAFFTTPVVLLPVVWAVVFMKPDTVKTTALILGIAFFIGLSIVFGLNRVSWR
jgi:hypothetical protein